MDSILSNTKFVTRYSDFIPVLPAISNLKRFKTFPVFQKLLNHTEIINVMERKIVNNLWKINPWDYYGGLFTEDKNDIYLYIIHRTGIMIHNISTDKLCGRFQTMK